MKADKEIMSEIAAIIRQITASVTFLPILEEACESGQGRGGGVIRGWGCHIKIMMGKSRSQGVRYFVEEQ